MVLDLSVRLIKLEVWDHQIGKFQTALRIAVQSSVPAIEPEQVPYRGFLNNESQITPRKATIIVRVRVPTIIVRVITIWRRGSVLIVKKPS